MQINFLLQQANRALLSHVSTPQLDAEILLAHVLNKPRSYLHAWPEQILSEKEVIQFNDYLARRRQLEPIAYITGIKEFWSLLLHVSPAVLIPRPETELLVERILALPIEPHQPIQFADLGTGCGSIALSIAHERPHWHIDATDLSSQALKIAEQNAKRLRLTNISFHQGSWCEALPKKQFTILVSNPPYIAQQEWDDYANELVYEPITALVSGDDGLEAIREICCQAKNYLKSNSYILMEHGFKQGAKVHDVFTKEGYQDIITCHDLSGHARVTSGRYQP